jgi:KDO2-lipid IV(A) lauroyltransferase
LREENLFPLNLNEMDSALYFFARLLVAFIQSLPLIWVARLGRVVGGLAYRLDARHRKVVLSNLTMCFGAEKSPDEIRAIAAENFRRIGENFACAVKTAAMSIEDLRPHLEFAGVERLPRKTAGEPLPNIVVAIGHFGNFELCARFGQVRPDYQCVTTYRALKQPAVNRLMQRMRERSGCRFFERRTEGSLLRGVMQQRGIIMGFLTDQSTPGLRGPFLGHDCSTTLAPAIFALRYHCELFTGFCFRLAPARWRVELGEKIATHEDGRPRTSEAIMRDVNRSFEDAVRRDPANWFWVHRRWKPVETKARRLGMEEGKPA